MWLHQLLSKIGYPQQGPTIIHNNNQGTNELVKAQEHHKKSKHIDVRYHYICKQHNTKLIALQYICSHNNIANILTKALLRFMFAPLHHCLSVCTPGTPPSNIHLPPNLALNKQKLA